MKIHVTDSLHCPKCGVPEVASDGRLNIRGYKVHHSGHWWSQCLRCAGYDSDAPVIRQQIENVSHIVSQGGPNFDPNKGWFK